eukprot:6035577-Amphidinium_carterae.5
MPLTFYPCTSSCEVWITSLSMANFSWTHKYRVLICRTRLTKWRDVIDSAADESHSTLIHVTTFQSRSNA